MPLQHYEAPTSLAQAVSILAAASSVRVLAGGTDLLAQMRLGLRDPVTVVDVKRIPELVGITLNEEGLRLGAAVPAAVVTGHAEIGRLYPGFAEGLGLIGSSQIQGRCSVGGNLCNASPAADSVPGLIVCRAVCNIRGVNGERSVAAEDFNTGPARNCLAPDELLVDVHLPLPAPRSSSAYLRFIPRTEMDIAVAGAAVALTLDAAGICTDARVAIGAVAPTALLVPGAAEALIGTGLDDASLRRAGAAAGAAASPITDKRGTADYRRKVVGVLVRRAAAIARARIDATA